MRSSIRHLISVATTAAGALVVSQFCLAAGEITADRSQDVKDCELGLKERFAIRRSVTIPVSNDIVISCESGGPGVCGSRTDDYPISKAVFVAAAGLGSPSNYSIERADSVMKEQSGGAEFGMSYDAEAVHLSWKVSKGWFGGGQTPALPDNGRAPRGHVGHNCHCDWSNVQRAGF